MRLVLRPLRRALCATGGTTTASANTTCGAIAVRLSSERCSLRRFATTALRGSSTRSLPSIGLIDCKTIRAYSTALTDTAPLAPPSIGQKKSGKAKKGRLDWNVHEEILVRKTPLPQVLDRLIVELENNGLSVGVRRSIDMFYFNCVEQVATLSQEFTARLIDFYETTLIPASDGGEKPLNDGFYPMIARLYLANGSEDKAWGIVERIVAAGKIKIHFRLVAPLLEYECKNRNFKDLLTRWRWLKQQEMEWTATMEDTLVDMIIACQLYHNDGVDSGNHLHDLRELMRDLSYSTREISSANATRLRNALSTAGFTATYDFGEIAEAATCSGCQSPYQKFLPTQEEYARILHALETTVALKNKTMKLTTKEFLAPFKRWLLYRHAKAVRDGKLHYILDGPNIAYLNQNYDNGNFRFDHIDRVADMLTREGHVVSITIPHAYLEESMALHIRTSTSKSLRRKGQVIRRKRSPEDKAIIDKWTSQGALFSCRTDALSDDVFWLYASALLGDEGRVVTNDQGRDHIFKLQNKKSAGMTTWDTSDPTRISIDLLTRWREATIVNVAIQHALQDHQESDDADSNPKSKHELDTSGVYPVEKVELAHPTAFTRMPQVASTTMLHFPVASEYGAAWLCLSKEHSGGTQ